MLYSESPLGKKVAYIDQYNPDLLFVIPRQVKRIEIGISHQLPFYGVDRWHAFELSWLNPKGKPEVAMARFVFPCETPWLVESKSFKLYLNSFNQTSFKNKEEVREILQRDLSDKVSGVVTVTMRSLDEACITTENFTSISLDDLDIAIDTYEVNPQFLTCEEDTIQESVHTHLLKSNCSVTGQPDWGSLEISYQGRKINHSGLLRYIISFRNHNEFHEQCVERIFMDILRQCKPQQLSVDACFTRRGGLDINPFRTTEKNKMPKEKRLMRQ